MAEDDLTADYAVIGVGSIAEAIVTGLCKSPTPPSVVLSPRSRKRTARLAERYPTVRVATDNQAAASGAGTEFTTESDFAALVRHHATPRGLNESLASSISPNS